MLHARGSPTSTSTTRTRDPDADWAAALNDRLRAAVVFANTAFAGKAQGGGFDGLYTYDVFIYDGIGFRGICRRRTRRPALRTIGRPRLRRVARDG